MNYCLKQFGPFPTKCLQKIHVHMCTNELPRIRSDSEVPANDARNRTPFCVTPLRNEITGSRHFKSWIFGPFHIQGPFCEHSTPSHDANVERGSKDSSAAISSVQLQKLNFHWIN